MGLTTRSRIEKPVQVTKRPPHPTLKGAALVLHNAYLVRAAFQKSGDIFEPVKVIFQRCMKNDVSGTYKLSRADCEYVIWKYVHALLAANHYQPGAIVLWGPDIFTPEPKCTQLVWEALSKFKRNIFLGGGSQSKTWSAAVKFGLRYIEDPENTCYKVMSVTKEHAKRNVFAAIKNLLVNTMVPIPNIIIKAESIQVNDDDKQGIHLVTIPIGDDGKGRLRGFHPVPRQRKEGEETNVHPKFGALTCVGVLLDEAEEVPNGVWEDINNILLTETAIDSNIEVCAATNPRDRLSKIGEYSEPVDGWGSLDIESSTTWESARGWHVTRLDPKYSENVVQRKVVYPGLQTFEGYENLLKLGENNPEYFTMGRGWFPEMSATTVIITEAMFNRAKGLYHFIGPVISAGSNDLAFEGNDAVIFTHLRHGEADGWTDMEGKFHKFTIPRRVIQVEQQMSLPKLPSLEQARAIMRLSRDLTVKPIWLVCDRTGAGTGVHDCLCSLFGPEVMGMMWSWAPTQTRILDDDAKTCDELYKDIITEMAWSTRRFIETDMIKLHPGVNWNELERQTVTRKYSQVGRGFLQIQSKKDFKRQNGDKSPDRFDSLIQGIQLIRMNAGVTTVAVQNPNFEAQKRVAQDMSHGIVDILEFQDMSQD